MVAINVASRDPEEVGTEEFPHRQFLMVEVEGVSPTRFTSTRLGGRRFCFIARIVNGELWYGVRVKNKDFLVPELPTRHAEVVIDRCFEIVANGDNKSGILQVTDTRRGGTTVELDLTFTKNEWALTTARSRRRGVSREVRALRNEAA